MKEWAAQLLEDHPELQQFLGCMVLLLLVASLVKSARLWSQWRSGQLVGNQLPPLRLDELGVLGFFLTLVVLIYGLSALGFGLVTFHVASLLAVMITWAARRVNWREQLGWSRSTWGQIFFGSVGGAAALYLPLQLVTVGWERCGQAWGWPPTEQPAVELFMQTHDPTKLIGLFLFAVVLAPLGEEILFRGFLQPWLKSRLNGSLALISTAILFAGIHGHAPTFLPLLVLGLVLGLVYEYTGSWWRCVGLHAGFNAMTAGLILLLKSYQP